MGLLYGGMALFGMGLPWGVLSAGLFYAGLRLALLSGEVRAGMTLVVFTCRGRPAALNGATLRRYGSLWDGASLGGTFRRAVLRRPAPCFAFCKGALCHTLRGLARCSPAPGFWDGPEELACRVPSSWSLPARAPGVLASPERARLRPTS